MSSLAENSKDLQGPKKKPENRSMITEIIEQSKPEFSIKKNQRGLNYPTLDMLYEDSALWKGSNNLMLKTCNERKRMTR